MRCTSFATAPWTSGSLAVLFALCLCAVIGPAAQAQAQTTYYNATRIQGWRNNMVADIAFLRDNVMQPSRYVDSFDRALIQNEVSSGDLEAATFATTIERILRDKVSLLEKLRDKIQEAHANASYSGSADYVDAATAPADLYGAYPYTSARGDLPADITTSAVVVPGWSQSNARLDYEINLSGELEELFQSNRQADPTVAFQYFGGANTGLTRYYPHFQFNNTDSLDARFQSWYTTALTGYKGLVLIIDTSRDTGDDFEYIKLATIAVLNSLHESDHVMLLIVSGNEMNRPECVSSVDGYVRATPQAIEALVAVVEALERSEARSGAGTRAAFEEALTIFERESTDYMLESGITVPGRSIQACQNALIFIGSGRNIPSPDSLSGTLPTSLIYTVGSEDNSQASVLACSSSGSSFSFASGDGETLYKNVTNYSAFLATVGQNAAGDPSWLMSLGFTRTNSLTMGVMLSASLAVFPVGAGEDGALALPIGVVGIDFILDDLIFAEQSFEVRFDYGFLVNSYGDTVLHPVMRDRSKTWSFQTTTRSPLHYDISTYEPTEEFNENVRDPMFNEQSGFVRILQNVDLPAGDTTYEGIVQEAVNMTYFWQKLASFPFLAVRALSDERLERKIFRPSSYHRDESITYYYYKIDNYSGSIPAPVRDYFDEYQKVGGVNFDTGCFQYAAQGWLDSQYFLQNEVSLIGPLMEYVNELPGSSNPGIQEEVKDDMMVAWPILTDWMDAFKNTTIYDKYKVLWIYAGSPLGSIYSFPTGSASTPTYDSTARPWRDRAASQPGKVVLSSPYVDAFGLGTVLTLSTTTASQGVNHVGIIGLDFSYTDFQETVLEPTNVCWLGKDDASRDAQCFIFDQSGLLLVHPDFNQSTTNKDYPTENVFVGTKAGELAQALVDAGFFYQQSSIYRASNPLIKQTVFLVNDTVMEDGVLEGDLASGGCITGKYTVVPLQSDDVQTTMYLVVIHNYEATDDANCLYVTAPAPEEVVFDTCADMRAEYLQRRSVLAATCPPPFVPSENSFEQLRSSFGADTCQVPKELTWVEWNDPVAIVFLALLFLTSFIALLVLLFFVYFAAVHADKALILKQTGLVFNFVVLTGLVLASLAILPFIGEPTDRTCAARPWMILFWVFIYGNLVSKMAFILKTKLNQKDEGLVYPKYSWVQLVLCNLALIAIEVVILVIWTAVDAPTPERSSTVDDDKDQLICESEHRPVWYAVQFFYMALVMLAGVVLAVLVGRTPTRFDEARLISFAIYGATTATVLAIITFALLEPVPDAALALVGFSILLGVVLVLSFLFFTKMFRIFMQKKREGKSAITTDVVAKVDADEDDGLDDL
ncbi:hypothetical protein QOT17_002391 [Balamuthia mandrillaris]